VEIVTTGDPTVAEFKRTFDTMIQFMDAIGLPYERQRRVRAFLSNSQDMMASNYFFNTLNVLSPELQGELAAHTVGESLHRVPFLNPPVLDAREQQEIVPTIARSVTTVAFAGGELIHPMNAPVSALLIIEKGLVTYGKRLLGMKDVLQQEFICKQAKTSCIARAVTHTTCLSLQRRDLERILEQGVYPAIKRSVRRTRIRVLLHTSMRKMLHALRASGKLRQSKHTAEEFAAYKAQLLVKGKKSGFNGDRLNIEYFQSVLAEVQIATKLDNEDKLERVSQRLERRIDVLETKMQEGMGRLEAKLDQLLSGLK
jgi:CRP-like cAMP-binding protein